jgi:RHS repeat-associated protein
MNPEQQGQGETRHHYALSRIGSLALFTAPALIASALLINAALPGLAQSQINGRVISAPKVAAHPQEKPKLPKAPAQVAMPAAPPMRIVPGMAEVLVATGPVDAKENADLDAALKEFHDAPLKAGPQSDFADYGKPLLAFIAAHPHSNWNSALQLNLGLGFYHSGYFTRAFTHFENAWQLGRNATSPQARLMVDRAVGELAKMHARIGHEKELDALFADLGKRPIGGPATELIQGAREGLWDFHNNPGEAYLCGPKALSNVLKTLKARPEQIKVAEDARSGKHGFSLTQLAALAGKAHLKYTLIERRPGQPVPVPSIIHWKVHHYAAITGMQNGKYLLLDPTFGAPGGSVLTANAIDAESSGYFLVPASAYDAKAGWRKVAANSKEAGEIYGMGRTSDSPVGATMPSDCCLYDKTSQQMNGMGVHTVLPANRAPGGMTIANAHMMTVSLNLTDTPVGYVPQKGLPALSKLAYNSREGEQPATFAFSNIGPKWSFSWLSYIQDDPVNPGVSMTRVSAGGGGYDFPNSNYYASGALAGRTVNGETLDQSQLWRSPVLGTAASYEHRLADGSKEVFALSDGATTFPHKLFLTSVVDPQGNVTTLNYDASFRLTSVVDAMGRSTTFTYGISASPLLITQITDPFGRSSQLTYDTSGRLASITDPVGITSTFTYSNSEPSFITNLTTPYGTSTFSDTPNPNDSPAQNTRSLTMTDPLGFTDFLYFYQNLTITPATDPTNTIPTGMQVDNGLLHVRNTYHWDPHAFAQGVTMSGGVVQSEDFSKASLTHWLHDQNINLTGRGIGSIKKTLERRIWFNYPNQGQVYFQGSLNLPTIIGRVLDDGTSQETFAAYNTTVGAVTGELTSTQDAKGRYTQINYAGNNIDVTAVYRNKFNPASQCGISCLDQMAAFTWNTAHRPLTMTDAAGKVWHYAWTTAGQINTVTDPNSKVTTYNYDSLGRLSTIVNANSQTQATYTYDSADRIATYTDSQGYTLTYGYDNLDRMTSITYPDGTTDLYDYNFQSGPNAGTPSLELRKHTDRLGRVTTYDFDADRRLISVTEPTTATTVRTTSYSYYENGTLKEITDANGNITHWDIDIESRPIDKIYAFGTSLAQTETYAYEPSTSRLKSITDALGQVKTLTYDKDDRVSAITYTNTVNPTPNVTYTWDPIYERLKSMTDGLGTTNFTYVPVGTNGGLKLSSITGPFLNNSISLTYDTLSRMSARNITGGNETFGYDVINRLTSHGTPLGTFTNTYLGQTSQQSSRSVTNGTVTVSTNWGYDTNVNDRRLISITNSGVTRSFTLGYGSPVNPYDIMSITDTAAAGHPFASQSHSYGYDLVDRLLTASSTTPGNYSYGYDNLDNATSVTDPAFGTTSPTYNGLNQVQTFNTNTYSYDANGNTTSDGLTKNYKWDAENRLIEIDYIGTTAKSQFSYDGMGHRTVDTETDASGNVTTRRFLWCGSRICQTRDGADTVQSRILPEGEYNTVTTQKAVYMPDQLGSVRDVFDATSGNLLASLDYSPYGNPVRTNGSFTPFYQYAKLARHVQSSLNFATFRAQDGITGTFPNSDPIAEIGGINRYMYSGAQPINYSDPTGLCKVEVRYKVIFTITDSEGTALETVNHAYIVTTDPSGNKKYFRGGPSGVGIPNWGHINAQYGDYIPGTKDWDSGSPSSDTVLDDGKPCTCENAALQNAAQYINNASISYSPGGPNSNTTAHYALGRLGITLPNPTEWVPGWSQKLPIASR